MIEYLDPRKIKRTHEEIWYNAGWNYSLDYPWIISKIKSASYILDVGCGVLPYSPLGRFLAEEHDARCEGLDRLYNKHFENFVPTRPPDVILWASALEHNSPEKMRELYLKSMEMLALGGMFIATIAIAPKTVWFEPSIQTNLSVEDALKIFDEQRLEGDYNDVWNAYRSDEIMMSKYTPRYGHFDDNDPVFVTAGVIKRKKRA